MSSQDLASSPFISFVLAWRPTIGPLANRRDAPGQWRHFYGRRPLGHIALRVVSTWCSHLSGNDVVMPFRTFPA